MRATAASILLFYCLTVLANSEWPGKPPDCWKDGRNIHYSNEDSHGMIKENVSIERTQIEPEGAKVYSQNKGYYFIKEGFRGNATITIYAEKEHYWKITISKTFGAGDPKWINEKLLYIRIWWGRIAFDDIIYDVENENVILSESGTDAFIAHQQFLEGCARNGGCECIQKKGR